MLSITNSNTSIVHAPARPQVDPFLWLHYFDPQLALQDFVNYIETLPSSRHERHTMHAYMGSLADFCAHLGATVNHYGGEDYDFDFSTMHAPNHHNTQRYMADLKRRGLSSSTIQRYMAAVRHFVRALEMQEVYPQSGTDFVLIMEMQRQFRQAIAIKNPAPDRTSNRPALEQHGQRLNLIEVNRLFEYFADEIDTLIGQRDLAILYLGITSGLRAAELARITLDNIREGKDCYEVHVRGKRNNFDPVGIDTEAYDLIMQYVTTWNNRLTEDDPRRIEGSKPVFQPLLKGDHIPALGLRGYDPASGLTARAILKLVARRTEAALNHPITAHDMRRTCAYLMRSNGYEWDLIRDQLRHRSIGTTERYVGREQDLSRALLSRVVEFTVPHAQPPAVQS
ncbi:MAG: site-specific integrase [Anaerolineae bacterium]|nr:site-specific integrase [Anaerolineae bacterium]